MNEQTYVGVASTLYKSERQVVEGYDENLVLRDVDASPGRFEDYLREKMAHFKQKDSCVLEPFLRQHKRLFYGIESTDVGSTSQREHGIDTGTGDKEIPIAPPCPEVCSRKAYRR